MDSDFSLSEEDNDKIYKNQIYENFKHLLKPSENPLVVILGGQPGSGKSVLTEYIQIESRNNFFVIDGDYIRTFHPHWIYLLKNLEDSAPNLTQNDSNKWVEKLRNDAIKSRTNIIIEGTMRNSEVPLNTARLFKNSGYRVEAHILAVPKSISILGIYERYEIQKSTQGYGRFSPIPIHDQAYNGIPKSIDILENRNILDGIFIYGRRHFDNLNVKLVTIYKNFLENKKWAYSPKGSFYLEEERRRKQTSEEKASLALAWENVLAYAKRRHNVPKSYIADIHRYRRNALNRVKKDNESYKILQGFGVIELQVTCKADLPNKTVP